jgi:fructose-specific component phosphotransferase system IIB-like protein
MAHDQGAEFRVIIPAKLVIVVLSFLKNQSRLIRGKVWLGVVV